MKTNNSNEKNTVPFFSNIQRNPNKGCEYDNHIELVGGARVQITYKIKSTLAPGRRRRRKPFLFPCGWCSPYSFIVYKYDGILFKKNKKQKKTESRPADVWADLLRGKKKKSPDIWQTYRPWRIFTFNEALYYLNPSSDSMLNRNNSALLNNGDGGIVRVGGKNL